MKRTNFVLANRKGNEASNVLELTFFTSVIHFITVGALVFLGQFVYAAFGFGAGMVTVSLYAILYGDLKTFVPFFLIVCIPVELFIVIKERRILNFKEIGRFVLFILPALIVGTYLLKRVKGEGIVLILGLIIAALALFYLFYEEKIELRFKDSLWIPILGSISGVLGSMYGIAGPPLILYYKSKRVSKAYFRAVLLSLFFFLSIIRIVSYTVFDLFSTKIFMSVLWVLPFTLLGLFLGNVVHHRFEEGRFKKLTSLVLLCSGIVLIVKNSI